MLRGANVGICAATHQFTTVGQYAMIAANATVVKDVPPLAKFIPGKELGMNIYAVRKWDLPLHAETLAEAPRGAVLPAAARGVGGGARPAQAGLCAEMVVADSPA